MSLQTRRKVRDARPRAQRATLCLEAAALDARIPGQLQDPSAVTCALPCSAAALTPAFALLPRLPAGVQVWPARLHSNTAGGAVAAGEDTQFAAAAPHDKRPPLVTPRTVLRRPATAVPPAPPSAMQHLPIEVAASKAGVCMTTFKKVGGWVGGQLLMVSRAGPRASAADHALGRAGLRGSPAHWSAHACK